MKKISIHCKGTPVAYFSDCIQADKKWIIIILPLYFQDKYIYRSLEDVFNCLSLIFFSLHIHQCIINKLVNINLLFNNISKNNLKLEIKKMSKLKLLQLTAYPTAITSLELCSDTKLLTIVLMEEVTTCINT